MPTKSLLFNTALQVLASIVRPKEKNKVWLILKSVRSGRQETKLSLFSGDVIIYRKFKGIWVKLLELMSKLSKMTR